MRGFQFCRSKRKKLCSFFLQFPTWGLSLWKLKMADLWSSFRQSLEFNKKSNTFFLLLLFSLFRNLSSFFSRNILIHHQIHLYTKITLIVKVDITFTFSLVGLKLDLILFSVFSVFPFVSGPEIIRADYHIFSHLPQPMTCCWTSRNYFCLFLFFW